MSGTGRKYKMLLDFKGWRKGRVYGPDPAGSSLVGWNRAVWVEAEPPAPVVEAAPEPEPVVEEPEPVIEEQVVETAAVEPETENAAIFIKPKRRWSKKEIL